MLIEKMNLRNADEMKATSTAENIHGRSHSQIIGMIGRQGFNALGTCVSTSMAGFEFESFGSKAAQEKRGLGRNIVTWHLNLNLAERAYLYMTWLQNQ